MVKFGKVFENLKLAVQQCYQIGHFELVKKLVKNSNATF